MAYDVPAAGPRTRPATVTAAVYLLYLSALLGAIGAILALTTAGATKRALTEAYKNVDNGASIGSVAGVSIIVVAVIGLLFAVGYAILAMFLGRGSNAARIVTWVLLGLSVCCGGGSLLGNAAGMSFGSQPAGAPDRAEVQRQVNAALPSWYPGVALTLGIIGVLISLTVVVLLLLPASNAFFRRQPAQVWQPPVEAEPPFPSAGPPPAAPPPPAASPQPEPPPADPTAPSS